MPELMSNRFAVPVAYCPVVYGQLQPKLTGDDKIRKKVACSLSGMATSVEAAECC